MRVHKSARVVAEGSWLTNCWPTKSQICLANALDDAVRVVTAMWIRWRSSPVVITLCITRSSVRTTRFYHHFLRITVIVAFPVRVEMSGITNAIFIYQPFCPILNHTRVNTVRLRRRKGIPALAFTFSLHLEALHWLSKVTLLVI